MRRSYFTLSDRATSVRRRARTIVGMVVTSVLLSTAGTAAAGTVEETPDQTIVFSAALGEVNSMSVTWGQYQTTEGVFTSTILYDAAHPITINSSRCSYDPARPGGHAVICKRGRSQIYLGDGNDQITFTGDRTGEMSVSGGSGSDTITNSSWTIGVYFGDDGNDVIRGGFGAYDTINGGPGDDTLYGRAAGAEETINGDGGNDVIATDPGGGGELRIWNGGPGNDRLLPGPDWRNYRIAGDDGRDTVDFAAVTEGLNLKLGLAGSQPFISPTTEVVIGGLYDDVINGGPTNDTIIGSGGEDQLFGRVGDDSLDGGKGNDVVRGNEGNDTVDGGLDGADDYISGGEGTGDIVTYAARTAPVRVSLDGAANDGEAGEDDQVVATEQIRGGAAADLLIGSWGANKLYGGNGDDELLGAEGADALFGEIGNDLLDGAAGADILDGGKGTDTATYTLRSADLVIDLDNVADDGESGEADDVRSTTENVRGGSGADQITGSTGANKLYGAGGSDVLVGGFGIDLLDGGPGGDALDSASDNNVADINRCGTELDTVQADFKDTVDGDCETVSRV